jgi:hypothetical protein
MAGTAGAIFVIKVIAGQISDVQFIIQIRQGFQRILPEPACHLLRYFLGTRPWIAIMPHPLNHRGVV